MNADRLEVALEYLSMGYSIVPLRGKEPAMAWSEYTMRQPTVNEVMSWWTNMPSANIGLVTGRVSGIVGVDVDPQRGGDLSNALDKGGSERVVRTGNGWHIYYRYPDSESWVYNRVGKDGLDVRGDGGILVLPPSVHSSGKRYIWQLFGDPGPAPSWVLQSIRDKNNTSRTWISELLQGVPEGQRNDSAARLAGYMYRIGLPEDIAESLLSLWDARNRPPLGSGVIERTARSVYATAQRRSELPVKPSNPPVAVPMDAKGRYILPKYDGPFVVDRFSSEEGEGGGGMTWTSLDSYGLRYNAEDMQWAIDEWLPSRGLTMAIAPPGTYKTWLMLDLALSVATGRPFLGMYPVREKGPVLLLQLEDSHSLLSERLSLILCQKEMGDRPFLTKKDGVFSLEVPMISPDVIIHEDRSFTLLDIGKLRELEIAIRTFCPILVIIDPLYMAGSVDDYFAATAKRIGALKGLRDVYGCGFVIAHHTRKVDRAKAKDKDKDEGMPDREDAWGSQFLNANLETGWQIRRPSGDDPDQHTIVVTRHHKNSPTKDAVTLTFAIDKDPNTGRRLYHVYPYEGKLPHDGSVSLLDWLQSNGPASSAEITEALGLHRSTVNRKLRHLMEEGLVEFDEERNVYIIVNTGY